MQLNIALNYGGQQEIVRAAQKLAERVAAGAMKPEEIDRAAFEGELYTAGLPDVDLLIRTSGEMRLSNFLLVAARRMPRWCYQTETLLAGFRPRVPMLKRCWAFAEEKSPVRRA